ncbi:hypothetical protein ACSBR2_013599 [Camellia fascicularis]
MFAYGLQPPYHFATLVDFVCSKFNGLLPGEILLFCKILGHNKFALQNDIDMQNLTYCQHSVHALKKVFLSAPWANGLSHLGQHFEGGASEFRIVLRKYAVKCVEKARGELFGAHSISFDQLRWYSDAVMEHNPRNYINLEYDNHNHRFTRFKGFLLAAIAKDGNEGLFSLAYAIVNSENTTNWGRRYGEMCSNTDESFNSWIRKAHNLPITRMVDSIRAKLMRQMSKRRVASQIWTVWKSGRDLNDLVDPYFHMSEYRNVYAPPIYPIPTVINPNEYVINPSAMKRSPGRPKKKIILSRGKHVQQITAADVAAWETITGKHARNQFSIISLSQRT